MITIHRNGRADLAIGVPLEDFDDQFGSVLAC